MARARDLGREGWGGPPSTAMQEGLGGPEIDIPTSVDDFHDVHEYFQDEFIDTESLLASNFGRDIAEIDVDLQSQKHTIP